VHVGEPRNHELAEAVDGLRPGGNLDAIGAVDRGDAIPRAGGAPVPLMTVTRLTTTDAPGACCAWLDAVNEASSSAAAYRFIGRSSRVGADRSDDRTDHRQGGT
jgi:hypothetical protein